VTVARAQYASAGMVRIDDREVVLHAPIAFEPPHSMSALKKRIDFP